MDLLIHQLLLLGSLAALWAAGWRLAGAVLPSGLLRVLAGVTLAAAAAILSAMVLGTVSLGASPVALSVASAAIWLAARTSVEARGSTAWRQLAAWWTGLPCGGRVARAALAGACLGYGIWVLGHPVLGLDALTDHLALPVDWVHNGRPGSLVAVSDQVPYASYPNTYEVLITWVTGIARTLVPAMLLTPAMLLVLGASVRAGLAEIGLSDRLCWLAAGALASLPLVVVQLAGANTDLPAMAWLACTAALAAGVRRSPSLLAVALVAGGLGAGVKTTVVPLAVIVLAIGAWRCRNALRGLVAPLLAAAAVAIVTGGFWYVRNLIDHGAPFWPLSTTPWGDPIPTAFRAIEASLLSHPGATLDGRLGDYGRALAGGLVLLAGAVLSPLWARRRGGVWAALIVVAALLVWADAPYTGIASNTTLAVGATRYLLACLLAATVTLALAGRPREVPSLVALGLAVALNLDRDLALRFPAAPSAGSLALVAAVAAALALGAELITSPRRRPRSATALSLVTRVGAPVLVTAAIAVALVGLLVPVDGFLPAHAGAGLFDAGLVRWLHSRAAFRDGSQPVAIGPVEIAVLTGARLAHPLVLLRASRGCAPVQRSVRSAWVVVESGPAAARLLACLAGKRPAYADASFLVYAPPALTSGPRQTATRS
ncbi:MAG: hypothetical protein ACR2MK_07960 [Solirubrobacteraceae bacterium]